MSHGCRGQLCGSFLLLSSLELLRHCSLQRPIDSVHSPLPSNPGRTVLSGRCSDSLAAPLCPGSLDWHPEKKESLFLPRAWASSRLFLSQYYCEINPSLQAPLSKEILSHEVCVPRVSGHLPSAHLSSGCFMHTGFTCQALGGWGSMQTRQTEPLRPSVYHVSRERHIPGPRTLPLALGQAHESLAQGNS